MDCECDGWLSVRHDVCVNSNGFFGLVRDGCVPFRSFRFVFPNVLFINIAHFSENWGYLGLSPIIASGIFALVFGRNLDAHQGPPDRESIHSPGSGPVTQCTQGKECYVAALYLTAGACFVAVLLSVWAALRDRRKIRDGVEARAGREVGWEGGYAE